MTCIVLKSPGTSLKFIKHLSYMHLDVKIQLQVLKRWVTIILTVYLSLLSDFFKYLSTNSTRFPTSKTLENTVHFSTQQRFIHQQYQYQVPNVNKSWKFIVCFKKILWGETMCTSSNVQNNPWEISACS